MHDAYTEDLTPVQLTDFPPTELLAMERDGVLWRAGGGLTEGWTSVDTPLSPTARAMTLAHLVAERETVIGAQARWVHLGGMQPDSLELATTPGGVRLGHPRITRRERVIPDASRERLGEVWVVTRARAAFDDFRTLTRMDDDAIRLCLAIYEVTHQDLLREAELAGRLHGIRAVRRALESFRPATVETSHSEANEHDDDLRSVQMSGASS